MKENVAFYYLRATMRLPSARIISPFSTRVFKMQVTFVGALSASSTTRIWPIFTALTFEDRSNKRTKVNITKSSSLTALNSPQLAVSYRHSSRLQQQHHRVPDNIPDHISHPRPGETSRTKLVDEVPQRAGGVRCNSRCTVWKLLATDHQILSPFDRRRWAFKAKEIDGQTASGVEWRWRAYTSLGQ